MSSDVARRGPRAVTSDDEASSYVQGSTGSSGSRYIALDGLQKMSGDESVVRELWRVMTKLAATCKEALKPQEVSKSLYGLQKMSSDVSEVRELLRVMTKLAATCKQEAF